MSEKNRKRRAYKPGRWAVYRERFQIPPSFPPRVQTEAGVPIDRILGSLMDQWGLKAEHWVDQLAERWEEVAGSSVAKHTRPGYLDKRTLTVYVDSSVWLHEMKRYGKAALLTNIQKRVDREGVQELRFVLDPGTPS